mgnify:CR=1 FL=1
MSAAAFDFNPLFPAGLPAAAALSNAPAQRDQMVVVPKVVE